LPSLLFVFDRCSIFLIYVIGKFVSHWLTALVPFNSCFSIGQPERRCVLFSSSIVFRLGFIYGTYLVHWQPVNFGISFINFAFQFSRFNMPFRSRRRMSRRRPRRSRRRPRRSRRLGGQRNQRVSTTVVRPLILGDSTIVRLRYGDSILKNTTATGDRLVLHGNGLFIVDPEAGSARQPVGFDQYIELYARYEVLSCTIKSRFQNLSAISPFAITVYPTFDVAADVQFNDASAYPYAVTKYVGTSTSGAFQTTLNQTMATRKLFGRTTASINFTGTDATNPSQLWAFVYEMFSLDNVTDLTYRFQFHATFTVRFFNRNAIIDQ